jgi:hypothetical protein
MIIDEYRTRRQMAGQIAGSAVADATCALQVGRSPRCNDRAADDGATLIIRRAPLDQ